MVKTHFDFMPNRFILSMPRREIFEFKVQACDFAFIGLYSGDIRGFAYEVVLGYNENTEIIVFDALTRDTLVTTNYDGVLR